MHGNDLTAENALNVLRCLVKSECNIFNIVNLVNNIFCTAFDKLKLRSEAPKHAYAVNAALPRSVDIIKPVTHHKRLARLNAKLNEATVNNTLL